MNIKDTPQYKTGADATDLIKLILEQNSFKVQKTSDKVDREDSIDLVAKHPKLGEFKIDCKKILNDYAFDLTLFFASVKSRNGNIPMITARGPFRPYAETTHLALKFNNDDEIKIVPFEEFVILNFFDKKVMRNYRRFFTSLALNDNKPWDQIPLHKFFDKGYGQFLPVFKEYYRAILINQERLNKKEIELKYLFLDQNYPDDASYLLQVRDKNKIIYPKETLFFKLAKTEVLENKKIDSDVQVNL